MLALFARRPPTQPTPAADVGLLDQKAIAEYREVARQVGVATDALDIEEFRHFLDRHDLPIFNRGEVVRYMDQITAATNPTGLGWQWCPVRAKDAKIGQTFGTKSTLTERMSAGTRQTYATRIPASDYFTDKTPAYVRVMPLHALRKIALIEKGFAPDKVRFLVTDYVLSPHEIIPVRHSPLAATPQVWPDPFLMAVIPNSDVIHGIGAFIIDVWDEPGFGLAQRLTPG